MLHAMSEADLRIELAAVTEERDNLKQVLDLIQHDQFPIVLTPESSRLVEDLIANPREPTQAMKDLMKLSENIKRKEPEEK